MEFKMDMWEIRRYKTTYIVEAESEEEAIDKALRGETEDETAGQLVQVEMRYLRGYDGA